jgi:hypothetical protein
VASLAGNLILHNRRNERHNQPSQIPEKLCHRMELEPPMNQQLFEFEREEYDDDNQNEDEEHDWFE